MGRYPYARVRRPCMPCWLSSVRGLSVMSVCLPTSDNGGLSACQSVFSPVCGLLLVCLVISRMYGRLCALCTRWYMNPRDPRTLTHRSTLPAETHLPSPVLACFSRFLVVCVAFWSGVPFLRFLLLVPWSGRASVWSCFWLFSLVSLFPQVSFTSCSKLLPRWVVARDTGGRPGGTVSLLRGIRFPQARVPIRLRGGPGASRISVL